MISGFEITFLLCQMQLPFSFVSYQPPRKPRVAKQKDVISRTHNKHTVSLGSEEPVNSQLDFSASESPHIVSGVSTGFTTASSQPPIGTPSVNSEAQAIKYIFLNRNFSF